MKRMPLQNPPFIGSAPGELVNMKLPEHHRPMAYCPLNQPVGEVH